jgi:hypothetical protein
MRTIHPRGRAGVSVAVATAFIVMATDWTPLTLMFVVIVAPE